MVKSEVINNYLNVDVENLSKTERKIHEYILHNYEHVIYSSLNQVAEAIGVGDASVVRYYNKLGYNNFVVFKMSLFDLVSKLENSTKIPFMDNIYDNMVQTLDDTKKLINKDVLDNVTKIICQCDQLFICGMGTSYSTVQDAFSKFIRIGVNCFITNDSHFMYMNTSNLSEKSAVLLYSYSGETAEVVKVGKLARLSKAKVIGITNSENSSVGRECDYILKTAGYERTIGNGFLCAKISQTYITDVLITSCGLQNEEKTKEYGKKVTNALIY